MKHICIYHKSCTDGFAAALAVKVFLEREHPEDEHKFTAAHYGDTPPNVTGAYVYIVDFSFPREVLLELHKQAAYLVVLDHHKTAEAALEGLEFCYFDMNRSGAMMAWQHFNSELPAPELFRYVQDRDLWQWKLENSQEISAALKIMPLDFDMWLPLLVDDCLFELIDKGRVILEYQRQEVARMLKHPPEMITLGGYTVPCINTTTLISEVGQALSDGYAFAATYFDRHDARVFSLRSNTRGENMVDVSAIAKQYGGGGHAAAAGFTLPKPLAALLLVPRSEITKEKLQNASEAIVDAGCKLTTDYPEADSLNQVYDNNCQQFLHEVQKRLNEQLASISE